jgi:zinc protease
VKNHSIAAVLAAGLLLAAPCAADSDATPPPPTAPRPLQLPRVERARLSNGLVVETVEDRRIPLVTVRLDLPAGSVEDPARGEGTAEAAASLLTAGIEGMSSAQIAEKVASLGGSLEASAGMDSATVSGDVLSENFEAYFDLLSRVVLGPAFPEKELAIYRANELEKLKIARSEPSFLASQRFNALLFGDHPYARISPTEASLAALDRERVEKFFRGHYGPEGSVLVVYGDVSAAKVRTLAEDLLGSWKGGRSKTESFPEPPHPAGRVVALVERPGSVQARIAIGHLAPTAKSADYFPLQVANTILGGGTASRLFLDIREKRGYTYDPGSSYAARAEAGTFRAGCTARNDVAVPAIGAFFEIFDAMADKPPANAELSHAKNYINGLFALRLATQAGVAGQLVQIYRQDLPEDWLEAYREKIAAVTPPEVREASRRYIDARNPVVVVVGDPNALGKGLAQFGPVARFDAEGRLLSPAP